VGASRAPSRCPTPYVSQTGRSASLHRSQGWICPKLAVSQVTVGSEFRAHRIQNRKITLGAPNFLPEPLPLHQNQNQEESFSALLAVKSD